CSTDRTRDIVLQYAAAHPDRIRVHLHPQNLGMNANFVATLQACRGTYIALLDGDDYWTSPSKLQKQVDFLDSHPDYSISFHNVTVVYEEQAVPPHPFHMSAPTRYLSRSIPKSTSTVEDLATGNFIQTGSVVYRAGSFDHLPDWFCAMPTYDWPLHVLNAIHGKIGYLDEVLGAYRVHPGGIWSMNLSQYRKSEDIEGMIRAFDLINRHLEYRYDKAITQCVRPLHFKAAENLYGAGRYREAAGYAKEHLRGLSFRDRRRQRFMRRVILSGYLPRAYGMLKRAKARVVHLRNAKSS